MNNSLQRLFVTIRLHRWYVILFFLTTVVMVTILSYLLPFVYEGHGSVMVIRPGDAPRVYPFKSDSQPIHGGGDTVKSEDVLSEMELFRSRPVIERTVDETHLDDLSLMVLPDSGPYSVPHSSFFLVKWLKSLQKTIKEWSIAIGLINDVDKRENTILTLQKAIKLKPIRSSNLFSVSFSFEDPRISAYVVNTLIKHYLVYRTEVYRPQAELNFIKEKQSFYQHELDEKKEQLATLLEQQNGTAQKGDDAKLDDLRSSVVYTAKLNEDYVEKLQELQSTSSLYLTNIIDARAVEFAAPTWKPVSPKRLINILLAIPLGLFGGVMVALMRENLGSAFHSAEEAATELGTTVLATIPEIRNNKNTERKMDAACYYVHTRLQATQSKPGIPVVVFTSGVKGAGVSTVARYYALFAARYLKLNTLLVDANVHDPQQHNLAKIAPSPGLMDVITKRKGLTEAVVNGGVENLSLLPCGTHLDIVPTPEQLLAWRANARQDFGLIIIDAPPASAGLSLNLCTIATSVIFMTRIHFGDSQTILAAYKALRESNAPLVGLLANRKLI